MSFQLFYTSSPKFNQAQVDSTKSLGGFISNSPIPNATLRNVFGDISSLTKATNRTEIRAIAIKSTAAPTKTGIQVYFTYPQSGSPLADSNLCTYTIGYASPTADNCGDLSTEKLATIYASPMTVTNFQSAVGIGAALALPNMDLNQYIVLYIKRTLKTSALAALTTEQLVAIMNETIVVEKQEDISLTLSWT